MPANKLQGLGPGKGRGVGSIVGRAGVAKCMRRPGVGMELVRFAELGKLGVELAHVLRRGVLVLCAKMSLDRAVDLARAIERRQSFFRDLTALGCPSNCTLDLLNELLYF